MANTRWKEKNRDKVNGPGVCLTCGDSTFDPHSLYCLACKAESAPVQGERHPGK